jgi:hypothetical protein
MVSKCFLTYYHTAKALNLVHMRAHTHTHTHMMQSAKLASPTAVKKKKKKKLKGCFYMSRVACGTDRTDTSTPPGISPQDGIFRSIM